MTDTRNGYEVGDCVVATEKNERYPEGQIGFVIYFTVENCPAISFEPTGPLELYSYEQFALFNPRSFSVESTATAKKEKSSGGPSSYYDMPFHNWTTTNDMMEYLAEHKWGRFGIHLKDIFKGLCRWGDKSGTDTLYDTKKVIYYGCRILAMISGKEALRAYLQELLDDKQFKGPEKC